MRLRKIIFRWLPSKKQVQRHFIYKLFGRHIFARDLWRMDSRSLAGGLSLGLFVAFTPTIPFQMILTCLGAFYFRLNLPVGLAACWVTNPLTAVFIYLKAWRLGRYVISHFPLIADIIIAYSSNVKTSTLMIHSLYLWTGSVILGGTAALISNLLIRLLWKENKSQELKKNESKPERTLEGFK